MKRNLKIGCTLAVIAYTPFSLSIASAAPNILLIIGDDMGTETLASYGLGEEMPTTAALDELAAQGVRFTNFWSQPVCSPTRATLLTGRYGFRTGVGRPIDPDSEAPGTQPDPPAIPNSAPREPKQGVRRPRPSVNWGLPLSEYTLPMAFDDNPDLDYATAAIGKWHLADKNNGWLDHPNLAGFDYFSGLILGEPESYFAWNKTVNGDLTGQLGYTPTDKVDDAIAWIDGQGDKPWFLWLAFNLPHTPLHLPPEEDWQGDHSDLDPTVEPDRGSKPHFRAMIEAMDTEIGRLLAAINPSVRDNTVVIFMGDNGTQGATASPPFERGKSKGTVYQGGVNVPMIVAGPGTARGAVSGALVNSTDMFNTILDLAGITPSDTATDSVSFLPLLTDPDTESSRNWIYADAFDGGEALTEKANYAIYDGRHKLLRHNGSEEFYDLLADPYEHSNLISGELSDDQRAALESLQDALVSLRTSAS